MNLLVSTNVYKPGQLARVIPHLHAFRGQIGVELFPMFDADCYEEELLHCLPEFEGIPVSFHGPYYETEHSAAPGTPEYAHSMDLIRQTLPYCVRLQSQYLVFHHNNIPVTEERREEMIRVSRENYREIAELFKPHQIPVVVENAGVLDRGNMLFDQDAFIQLCREEHYPVLADRHWPCLRQRLGPGADHGSVKGSDRGLPSSQQRRCSRQPSADFPRDPGFSPVSV